MPDYPFHRRPALLALAALVLALWLPRPALAWNAAGHRIVAAIAWEQLDPPSRRWLGAALHRHPDSAHWQQRAKSDDAAALFYEAATWADDIRNDPRYYDADREPAPPPVPGLPDHARHKNWHYVDLDERGHVVAGEIDRQIEQLSRLLRSTADSGQITWALPWLLHLVGDIHQPLHVGMHGDHGGNSIEVENPNNPRRPFTSLHAYWDDLPGPPWLRGKRLAQRVRGLLERYPAPAQGTIRQWRDASHQLLDQAYPATAGSLLPQIDAAFAKRSQIIAEQQLTAAGYRLGRLLAEITATRVSRETP